MKIKANKANAKRAHILSLLCLDRKPELKVLETDVLATLAREREAHWIRESDSPYLLNSTDGGEGVGNRSVSVYALWDPRNHEVFYVGLATDVMLRFKQHLKDALEISVMLDRAERHRDRWTIPERELIYSGADVEVTARALGRTIEAVRSHFNLSISSAGFASAFVIGALRAAFNVREAGKLKSPPRVAFYSEAPASYAHDVPPDLLAFAKSLSAGLCPQAFLRTEN
jgi:hypothetical protein